MEFDVGLLLRREPSHSGGLGFEFLIYPNKRVYGALVVFSIYLFYQTHNLSLKDDCCYSISSLIYLIALMADLD